MVPGRWGITDPLRPLAPVGVWLTFRTRASISSQPAPLDAPPLAAAHVGPHTRRASMRKHLRDAWEAGQWALWAVAFVVWVS